VITGAHYGVDGFQPNSQAKADQSLEVALMWWMYIGLGVVVAFLVIFVFAMLAASSTNIGDPSSRTDSHK
jgi:hypothetical protein